MWLKSIGICCLMFLISCDTSYTNLAVYELAKQTERIQVVFNERADKYQDITSRKQIRKFDSYISEEDTPVYNCGYDGYILFFTESGSVRMEFNLDDECQNIVYTFAQVTYTKKLTAEGLAYLRSVQPK